MNPGRPSLLSRVFVAAAEILVTTLSTASAQPSDPTPRIVVIGEVQGAANTVSAFLKHLELIDSEGHWSGGDTTLIQTGDLMDDGKHVRAALDLFMRLQGEAESAGGRVIVLMGNHEAMNILGELRDVNYMAYESFTGPDSVQRQRAAWQEWVAWRARRAEAFGTTFAPGDEGEWLALHPPGWIEYVESLRPEGNYGAWLRSLPVAVEIDDTLFIHAGISPAMEGMEVAAINRRAAEEIERFDRHRATMVAADLCLPTASAREMVEVINEEAAFLNGLEASQRTTANPRVATLLEIQGLGQWGSWSLVAENGPLWFPGASKWPDELTPNMTAILDGLGVEHMVTGQSDGKERLVRTRFDDRVLLTSVGPSDDPYARGGNPAALEIVNKDYFVVTLGGRELLIDGP